MGQLVQINRTACLPDSQVLTFNYRGMLVQFYLPNALHDGVQSIILRNGDFFEAGMLALA
jgi:hypothetical protein